MRQYAVIDADGFFGDTTKVYSAHATEKAAISASRRYKINGVWSAMVIRSEGGFRKGETIYRDTIRTQFPVVGRQ